MIQRRQCSFCHYIFFCETVSLFLILNSVFIIIGSYSIKFCFLISKTRDQCHIKYVLTQNWILFSHARVPSEKITWKHSSRETWSHPRNNSLLFHGKQQSWNIAFPHSKSPPPRNFHIHEMRIRLIIVMVSLAFFLSLIVMHKMMAHLKADNGFVQMKCGKPRRLSQRENCVDPKLNASRWKPRKKTEFSLT